MGNYYGAGACGLNFHRNQFFCTFRTRRVGSKATLLGTNPTLPGVEFLNQMHVGALAPATGDEYSVRLTESSSFCAGHCPPILRHTLLEVLYLIPLTFVHGLSRNISSKLGSMLRDNPKPIVCSLRKENLSVSVNRFTRNFHNFLKKSSCSQIKGQSIFGPNPFIG